MQFQDALLSLRKIIARSITQQMETTSYHPCLLEWAYKYGKIHTQYVFHVHDFIFGTLSYHSYQCKDIIVGHMIHYYLS